MTSTSSASSPTLTTTEWILGLLAAILVPANEALHLKLPVDAIVAVVGIVIAYITSRTLAKSAGAAITAGVRTPAFWIAILSSVAVFLCTALHLPFTGDQIAAFVALVASLIIGHGVTTKVAATPAPSPSSAALDAAQAVEKAVDAKLAEYGIKRFVPSSGPKTE